MFLVSKKVLISKLEKALLEKKHQYVNTRDKETDKDSKWNLDEDYWRFI